MANKTREGKDWDMRRMRKDDTARQDDNVQHHERLFHRPQDSDDVKSSTHVEKHYCISCAKSKRIFEKLKNRAIRTAAGARVERRPSSDNWNSGKRW